jgi:hypothetical protein
MLQDPMNSHLYSDLDSSPICIFFQPLYLNSIPINNQLFQCDKKS